PCLEGVLRGRRPDDAAVLPAVRARAFNRFRADGLREARGFRAGAGAPAVAPGGGDGHQGAMTRSSRKLVWVRAPHASRNNHSNTPISTASTASVISGVRPGRYTCTCSSRNRTAAATAVAHTRLRPDARHSHRTEP